MNLWKKLPASLMKGFLISAGQASAQHHLQSDRTEATSQPGEREFVVLFGLLPPEIARKLPLNLKAVDVAEMSPNIDDLRVQKKALALVAKAIEYIDREGLLTASRMGAEYREG